MSTHRIKQKWKSCQSWATAEWPATMLYSEHQRALAIYVFALRHTLMLSGKRAIFRWNEGKKDGNITCIIMWYMCSKFLNNIAAPPKSQPKPHISHIFAMCTKFIVNKKPTNSNASVRFFLQLLSINLSTLKLITSPCTISHCVLCSAGLEVSHFDKIQWLFSFFKCFFIVYFYCFQIWLDRSCRRGDLLWIEKETLAKWCIGRF